jgi:hypothetical protein
MKKKINEVPIHFKRLVNIVNIKDESDNETMEYMVKILDITQKYKSLKNK